MKARVINQQQLKYDVYAEHTQGTLQTLLAMLLYNEHLERQDQTKAYRKKLIQKMFYGVRALLSMPGVCGHEIGSEEVVKFMEHEYELDFSTILINTETKREFMKGYNQNLR